MARIYIPFETLQFFTETLRMSDVELVHEFANRFNLACEIADVNDAGEVLDVDDDEVLSDAALAGKKQITVWST